MVIEPVYLLYGLIFLGAFFLLEGAFYLVLDNWVAPRNINRRMRMLASGTEPRRVYETLRRRSSRRSPLPGILGRTYDGLDYLITQAGLTVSVERILMIMAALAGAVFITFTLLGRLAIIPDIFAMPHVAVGIGIVVGVVLPLVRLSALKNDRQKHFLEQLPDTLDVMVRSLHAGHPIAAAMGLVTKEMPDPIGSEFGIAVDEMTYGLELRQALENLGERVDIEEFKYVIVAINIQHETGGNLAEVLEGLSTVIRARFRMLKKIRALTAEGRLSMKILAALPVLFAAFAAISNPGFYINVMGDPLFWPIVGGALVLELLGIIIMHRLVNFRF